MKWISFIIEIAACIISFGICTAVIRAQFRPRDELAWEYVFFLPRDILKDGLLQKSSLLL